MNAMTTTASAEAATRDQLLRRATELVPVLAERARNTEELRRIPDDTVQDLIRTGLFNVVVPERFGGPGLEYDTVLEIGAELGRGCGSTAWCYTVWQSHHLVMGLYPEQAQEEFWGESPNVICSSAFSPAGARLEPTAGGYLLSGRWDFSSGCDAASWALLCAFVPDQGPGLLLVPRADYRIDDTWFVSGLKGTGSKDVVIDQPVFVPSHRFLAYGAMAEAQTPGRELHDRLMARVPAWSVMPFTLAAPLVGIGQGALEAYEARMRSRVLAFSGQNAASQVNFQMRLTESSVEIDCARLLLRHDLAELLERASRHDQFSVLDRVRFRRDQCYVAKLAAQAVNRLFEAAGGHSLFDTSPIQRAHRDVHAGWHQVALLWDTPAEQYGRVRMGLEPTDALI